MIRMQVRKAIAQHAARMRWFDERCRRRDRWARVKDLPSVEIPVPTNPLYAWHSFVQEEKERAYHD